jgi:phosphate transport system permease protein
MSWAAARVAGGEREGSAFIPCPGITASLSRLFTAVPAFLLMAAWLFVQPILIESQHQRQDPDSA